MSPKHYWFDIEDSRIVKQLFEKGKRLDKLLWKSSRRTLVDQIKSMAHTVQPYYIISSSDGQNLDKLHGFIPDDSTGSIVDILKTINWHRP